MMLIGYDDMSCYADVFDTTVIAKRIEGTYVSIPE
jgi:hypothetical protein